MTTFKDFVEWSGSLEAAGAHLGLSPSMVSLVRSGKRPLLPAYAAKAEAASEGNFRAEDLLPGTSFIRDADGHITGWAVPLAPAA